ncbi:MAG: hypothetical protein U0800_00310 [Isosphaeraceae bacterium]
MSALDVLAWYQGLGERHQDCWTSAQRSTSTTSPTTAWNNPFRLERDLPLQPNCRPGDPALKIRLIGGENSPAAW